MLPGESDQPCPRRVFRLPRRKITLPQIMAEPSALGLRFKISLSSIDPCPPFRERPTGRPTDNFRFNFRFNLPLQNLPIGASLRAPGPG